MCTIRRSDEHIVPESLFNYLFIYLFILIFHIFRLLLVIDLNLFDFSYSLCIFDLKL